MQRNVITVMVALATLLIGLGIFLSSGNVRAVSTSSPGTLTLSAISPSPSPTSTNAVSGGNDTAIPVALIGLVGTIVGALVTTLIGGAFMVYQLHRTSQIEKEKQIEQLRHEEELARFQKELEREYKAKEQQEQQRARKTEALHQKMLSTRTNTERAEAYRQALHLDPRISTLQILDMTRPLDVTNIYVQVRLYEDVRPGYELRQEPSSDEDVRDPTALLRSGQVHLEKKASGALDIDEAIRRYTHCVIVGDAGAGKTTLLKYLALKAADRQLASLPNLPIHINLNDFVSSGQRDLLDFASMIWDERYRFPQTDARLYMDEMLKAGDALLLLDALDETAIGPTADEAEASYRRVADAVVQLRTRYGRSPIIVTARKAGYQSRAALVGFSELEVLEFRQENIEQFIRQWFAFYQYPQKPTNADDLITQLRRNPRLQTLAANPLLLSLIVLVYEAQLELPDRRAELYRRCVEILLTEWDSSRNIRRRRVFKPEYKLQLLGEVAWHFHTQGQRYFPERELLEVIADFLPTVGLPAEQNKYVLEEISTENGLLKEQARDWYGFLHLTLQEYFVAKYALDHQELDILLEYRDDPWWEEVLLLYAGQVSDASPLLQKLLERGNGRQIEDELFHTDLLLAGRCLAASPRILQIPLREAIVSRLFDLLITTPYSLTRGQVANVLVAIGRSEIDRDLLHLLSDQQLDVDVRYSIAQALGTLGERSIAAELLRLLNEQQLDVDVRYSIAQALGTLGERSVIPELLRLLTDQLLETSVRYGITQALGALGERSVVSELLRLLTDQQIDSLVRQGTAQALGTLGERSIAAELLRLLSEQQLDVDVRYSIAQALGTLGERSVIPELLRLSSEQWDDMSLRQGIFEALVTLRERSIVPELVRLLADRQLDLGIRCRIVQALVRLKDQSVVPELLRLLAIQELDSVVRYCIAYALATLGDQSIVPELLRRLTEQRLEAEVRLGIIYALAMLGERSVIPELLRLLADQRLISFTRQGVAQALAMLKDQSAVPELLRLLSTQALDREVRLDIVQALEQITNDEATIKALAVLMEASDIASSIYKALWRISRRAQIKLIVTNDVGENHIKIVKRRIA
jgi:HEAT repeat protein